MTLAILSGAGQLPVMIKQAHPDAHVVGFEGMPTELADVAQFHRFERLGALFADLRDCGVTHIVMAGAMSRPDFAPDLLDAYTKSALPALMAAMAQGDDHLLRHMIALIEGQGFSVIGAHSLLSLTQPAGVLAGEVPADVERDIARADQVLKTLSPLDVGQGVVVENGLVLGIETLQGTDALLSFVAATAPNLRGPIGGVFVKRPKAGQDLRVDMPTIGPNTIDLMGKAGLSGIVISPDACVVVDVQQTIERANSQSIFIIAAEATL
ncbi:MAG: LpxI family protein [Rhodobacteraceae bacterium]|nr:LpxI family protein [Paracoccaceae bacterium]NCW03040.1 LpxI family protein [Paracoccaceae bacterium]NCX07650.1 LpxI family protein [Paracoccaceae bacterium]NCX84978.1 LpxI family protein [Paracoccaceae bacterium]NDD32935.1 LpxI family protein [Paracoccaceae bacterium]